MSWSANQGQGSSGTSQSQTRWYLEAEAFRAQCSQRLWRPPTTDSVSSGARAKKAAIVGQSVHQSDPVTDPPGHHSRILGFMFVLDFVPGGQDKQRYAIKFKQ